MLTVVPGDRISLSHAKDTFMAYLEEKARGPKQVGLSGRTTVDRGIVAGGRRRGG